MWESVFHPKQTSLAFKVHKHLWLQDLLPAAWHLQAMAACSLGMTRFFIMWIRMVLLAIVTNWSICYNRMNGRRSMWQDNFSHFSFVGKCSFAPTEVSLFYCARTFLCHQNRTCVQNPFQEDKWLLRVEKSVCSDPSNSMRTYITWCERQLMHQVLPPWNNGDSWVVEQYKFTGGL